MSKEEPPRWREGRRQNRKRNRRVCRKKPHASTSGRAPSSLGQSQPLRRQSHQKRPQRSLSDDPAVLWLSRGISGRIHVKVWLPQILNYETHQPPKQKSASGPHHTWPGPPSTIKIQCLPVGNLPFFFLRVSNLTVHPDSELSLSSEQPSRRGAGDDRHHKLPTNQGAGSILGKLQPPSITSMDHCVFRHHRFIRGITKPSQWRPTGAHGHIAQQTHIPLGIPYLERGFIEHSCKIISSVELLNLHKHFSTE